MVIYHSLFVFCNSSYRLYSHTSFNLNMKKHLSLILLLCSFAGTVKAQIYGEVAYLQPTGETGYVFKPGLMYTLGYRVADDPLDQFQLTIYASYYSLNARKDTFPVVAYSSEPPVVRPGYEVYEDHYGWMLGFGYQYRILDADFSPFAALDATVRSENFTVHSNYYGISEGSEEASLGYVGLIPKVGVSYGTDEFILDLGLGYSMNLTRGATAYYWQTALSIAYFFD